MEASYGSGDDFGNIYTHNAIEHVEAGAMPARLSLNGVNPSPQPFSTEYGEPGGKKEEAPRLSIVHGVGDSQRSQRRASMIVAINNREEPKKKPILDNLKGCLRCGETEGLPDAPDKISVEMWRKVYLNAKKREVKGKGRTALQVMEDIAEFANTFQPPDGFYDVELWKVIVEGARMKLDKDAGEAEQAFKSQCLNYMTRFLEVEDRKTSLFNSRVADFFLDFDASDFEFDTAVNSLALVNALVLTVPFGMITSFNHEFWSALSTSLSKCTKEGLENGKYGSVFKGEKDTAEIFNDWYGGFVRDTSTTAYASMCGLILATMYYLFRPSDQSALTRNGKKRQRLLLFCMFGFTFTSITALMITWVDTLRIMVRNPDTMCDREPVVVTTTALLGTGFLVLSFIIGVIFMY